MDVQKLNLKQILTKYKNIKIPDVQRDYVMGSGGDKLIKLFNSMNESKNNNEAFYFSCLMGHEDNLYDLHIYDGQQRLVTLICLCSYLNKDEEIQNLLNRFSFVGRNRANEWLKATNEIVENKAIDFTTYSLSKLISQFESYCLGEGNYKEKPCDKFNVEFLLEKVYFDLILVEKISDAEQFFLDVNDGLDLKSYEIFKAELYHHASEKLEKDVFKRIALKMENEWLNLCLKYKIEGINEKKETPDEEEILIFYLKYCFRMMWIEEKGNAEGYKESNVAWLKKEHFLRLETITDEVVEKIKNYKREKDNDECIQYQYQEQNMCIYIRNTGPHWNISNINYIGMLDTFFRSLNETKEIQKDIVIWCYISNAPKYKENIETLNEYLRIIKKILNYNRNENTDATIKYIDKNQDKDDEINALRVRYARYYVKGIPRYYLKKTQEDYLKNSNSTEDDKFFNSIVVMNKKKMDANDNLDEWLQKFKDHTLLGEILIHEKLKRKSSESKKINELENLPFINGLVDNFLDYETDSCKLNKLANEMWTQLKEIKISEYPYKDILKFICDNKLNIDDCMFEDVDIKWEAYTRTSYSLKEKGRKGSLIAHTWCDLFTNKNAINFFKNNQEYRHSYFHLIPDGWFENSKLVQDNGMFGNFMLVQPKDTSVDKKKGFAAWGDTREMS